MPEIKRKGIDAALAALGVLIFDEQLGADGIVGRFSFFEGNDSADCARDGNVTRGSVAM